MQNFPKKNISDPIKTGKKSRLVPYRLVILATYFLSSTIKFPTNKSNFHFYYFIK